jgi:thiol:disulfide interchange protein
MRMARRVVWGMLASFTVAACSSSSPTGDPSNGNKSVVITAAKVSEKDAEPTLSTVKWPELAAVLASQKGKVVVLDVWADY